MRRTPPARMRTPESSSSSARSSRCPRSGRTRPGWASCSTTSSRTRSSSRPPAAASSCARSPRTVRSCSRSRTQGSGCPRTSRSSSSSGSTALRRPASTRSREPGWGSRSSRRSAGFLPAPCRFQTILRQRSPVRVLRSGARAGTIASRRTTLRATPPVDHRSRGERAKNARRPGGVTLNGACARRSCLDTALRSQDELPHVPLPQLTCCLARRVTTEPGVVHGRIRALRPTPVSRPSIARPHSFD